VQRLLLRLDIESDEDRVATKRVSARQVGMVWQENINTSGQGIYAWDPKGRGDMLIELPSVISS